VQQRLVLFEKLARTRTSMAVVDNKSNESRVPLVVVLEGDSREDDQHWSLRLPGHLHIQALSLATWRLDVIAQPDMTDPTVSQEYWGSIHLPDVAWYEVCRIQAIARGITLNEGRDGWNYQASIMELLAELERNGSSMY
jgi:hypothetical protein